MDQKLKQNTSRPVLYMNIGIPCSGKSTFSNYITNPYFEDLRLKLEDMSPRVKILSTDLIIEDIADHLNMTYNECWADLIKFAEKAMHKKLNCAILKNLSMVWDQTNVSKKVRAEKLKKVPRNYRLVALYHSTDIGTVLDRNNKRAGKVIPEKVIIDMAHRLERPEYDEGFDDIYEVKLVYGEYDITRVINLKAECGQQI